LGSYQCTLRWGNATNFLKTYFSGQNGVDDLYCNTQVDITTSSWPEASYCSDPKVVADVWIKCVDSVGDE
jgi:hypothetical protein